MKLVLSKESPETKTRNEIQGGKIQTAEKYPTVNIGLEDSKDGCYIQKG